MALEASGFWTYLNQGTFYESLGYYTKDDSSVQ
jgi:hypothetical protein